MWVILSEIIQDDAAQEISAQENVLLREHFHSTNIYHKKIELEGTTSPYSLHKKSSRSSRNGPQSTSITPENIRQKDPKTSKIEWRF